MHSSRCLSTPSSCSEWFHSCSLYSLGNNFTACTTVILFPSLCINLTGSTQAGLGTSPRFHFYYLVVLCICKAARFSYQNIHFFIIFPGPPAPDNLFFFYCMCWGFLLCSEALDFDTDLFLPIISNHNNILNSFITAKLWASPLSSPPPTSS